VPRRATAAYAVLALADSALAATGRDRQTAFLAGLVALRRREDGGRLRDRPILAAPHLTAYLGLNAYLWPRTGKRRLPVLAHGTVLLVMSLVALDSRSSKTAAGGALFLASDSLGAARRLACAQQLRGRDHAAHLPLG